MAPLTWRNVDAPNFSSAIQGIATSGQLFNNAASGLTEAVDSFQAGRTQAVSSQLMNDILKNRSSTELNSALKSGIIGNLDPRYITPEALDFAANYQSTLLKNDLANRELALRGAGRGGRGSGGGGSGGGKGGVIPYNVNQAENGYISADGTVAAAPLDPTVTTPAATTVAALPTATREVPYVAPIDPITNEAVPSAQSIAALSNPVPVAQPAPVVATSTPSQSGSMIQPVEGYTRGPNRVKGNDGAAQIFPELSQDLAAMRIAAINGELDLANNTAGSGQRINRNLTGSNILTTIDNNVKAAEAGIELRGNQRKEADELRGRASSELARVVGDDALLSSVSPQDAKTKLAGMLNRNEIDVDTFRKSLDRVDENGATLAVFTDPTAQETPVVGGGDQPVEQTAEGETPKTPKAKNGAAAPQPTTPQRDPLAGSAIARAVQQFNDQIGLDQSGDLNAGFRSGFRDASNSDASPADLANKATGKGGAFENSNRDDYLNTINDIATRFRVKPAVAALMAETAVAGRSRTNRALWGDLFNGSVYVDEERLNQLGAMITDPATGRVRPELLQQNTARRESEDTQSNINKLYTEAGTAQANLDRAIGLVRQGRDPEKIKLKALQEKATNTQNKVSEAIAAATQRGGAASAYRGDTEAPATAEVVPNVFERRRPVDDIIPEQVTQRANAIYQRLVDQSNRELSRQELLQLRQQARAMALEQVNSPNAANALARAVRGN